MEQLSKNKIKLIQSLRHKKFRDEEGLFIVEGKKSISDFLRERNDLIDCIITYKVGLSDDLHYQCDERTYNSITSLKNGDGYLAIFKKPLSENLSSDITLVLDGIQDPGNLGTIIRTADWFGVKRIICSKDTVDCYNEKVIQATMGSLFRVSIDYLDLKSFLKEIDLPVYGALLSGENLNESNISLPCVLLLGNEGNGIRPEIIQYVDRPIHIPGKGKAESLNVAIAAGILIAAFSK